MGIYGQLTFNCITDNIAVDFILGDEHLALPQEVWLCFKIALGVLHTVQNTFNPVSVVRCDTKAHEFWVFLVRL